MSQNRPLSIFISHPSHYMTNCRPHGDGLLAFSYMNELAQRGHTLHVAVPLSEIEGTLHPNIRLYPMRSITRSSIINPSAPNRLEYAFRVRSVLNQVLRKTPIDLIHQLNPVVPGMSLLLGSYGIPIVLGPIPPAWAESDSSIPSQKFSPGLWLRDQILNIQCAAASAILIPTPASRDCLSRATSIQNKVVDLNYGIDTDHFSPSTMADSPGERPTILFFASMQKRKGVFTLLDAFEKVHGAMPTCDLLIAGNTGPEEALVKERILASPVKDAIRYLGRIDREDAPALLRQCTVYCLPSYGEPFGMTALEAMACGKAIVGTDAGGLGYLLDDRGAKKVKPGDIASLAEALLEVLRSPALQAGMGAHNRARALGEYSWDAVIRRLEDIYASVRDRGQDLPTERRAAPQTEVRQLSGIGKQTQ